MLQNSVSVKTARERYGKQFLYGEGPCICVLSDWFAYRQER